MCSRSSNTLSALMSCATEECFPHCAWNGLLRLLRPSWSLSKWFVDTLYARTISVEQDGSGINELTCDSWSWIWSAISNATDHQPTSAIFVGFQLGLIRRHPSRQIHYKSSCTWESCPTLMHCGNSVSWPSWTCILEWIGSRTRRNRRNRKYLIPTPNAFLSCNRFISDCGTFLWIDLPSKCAPCEKTSKVTTTPKNADIGIGILLDEL